MKKILYFLLFNSLVFGSSITGNGQFTTKKNLEYSELDINGDSFKIKTFALDNKGCDLNGKVKNNILSILVDTDTKELCQIKITSTDNGFELKNILKKDNDSEAQKNLSDLTCSFLYCDKDITFEGEYRPVPKDCSADYISKKLDESNNLINDSEYANANDILSPLYNDCINYTDAITEWSIINQYAYTNLKLRDKDACISPLNSKMKYLSKNNEDLKKMLSKEDLDIYLPFIKESRKIYHQCESMY